MRKAIIISGIGHIAIIVIAMVGLPQFMTRDFQEPVIIPIELVQKIDENAKAPPPSPKPEPEPEKQQEPEPQPEPEPPKEEAVAQASEPEPTPQEVMPDPVPEKKPEPKKEEKPEPKTPTVKPQRRPEAPKKFDPNRLSALLDKKLKEDAPQEKTEKKVDISEILKRQSSDKEVPPNPRADIDRGIIATNLQGLIRSQIQPCWSVPAGSSGAPDLQVRIRVRFQPDGSLARPPEIIDGGRMSVTGQEYYRAAAESARRAIQRCSPLKLPPETYDIWRDTELTFDPKDMLGG